MRRRRTVQENYGSITSGPGAENDNHSTNILLKDIITRRLIITLLSYAMISFTEMAIVALIPLMYSSSLSSGGLGLNSSQIGVILGVRGVFGAFLPFISAPIIQKKGPRWVYISSYMSVFIGATMFPILSFLAKTGGPSGFIWLVIALQIVFTSMSIVAYGEFQDDKMPTL